MSSNVRIRFPSVCISFYGVNAMYWRCTWILYVMIQIHQSLQFKTISILPNFADDANIMSDTVEEWSLSLGWNREHALTFSSDWTSRTDDVSRSFSLFRWRNHYIIATDWCDWCTRLKWHKSLFLSGTRPLASSSFKCGFVPHGFPVGEFSSSRGHIRGCG